MHELAITEGIVEVAVPAAEKAGAKRILEIHLKIGALSGVFPECIQDCLEAVTKGTIAEGAKLVVSEIPVKVYCRDCQLESEIDRKKIQCPHCGGQNFRVTAGREYFVESLKVE